MVCTWCANTITSMLTTLQLIFKTNTKYLKLTMQLPGANAGKPDVGAAAKDAAKKTPFGFMNMGDLAFDLPGSNVSKDDLPNNVKPGDAAGLPKGPTAKPPSGPSLPKVWVSAAEKSGAEQWQ